MKKREYFMNGHQQALQSVFGGKVYEFMSTDWLTGEDVAGDVVCCPPASEIECVMMWLIGEDVASSWHQVDTDHRR